MERKKPEIPDAFFDYLKSYLGNYPKESIEREIILLIFSLAYKFSYDTESLFLNWNNLYYKFYSKEDAIALCNRFIKEDLKLDISFEETIEFLRKKFPKEVP